MKSRDRGDHFKVVGIKKSGQDKQALGITVPLSSGKLHTLSMLSGAVKHQPKRKSGRAVTLPAPSHPQSLKRENVMT